MKAIRRKCLDCSAAQSIEVRRCVIPDCPLYPFRFGKRPDIEGVNRKKREMTPERLSQLDAARELSLEASSVRGD